MHVFAQMTWSNAVSVGIAAFSCCFHHAFSIGTDAWHFSLVCGIDAHAQIDPSFCDSETKCTP